MPPKKAAKGGKGGPEPTETQNQFDGINLEAKQVSTLILMLEGNEGSTVRTSVESLYKYADKSNENKLDLFKQKKTVPLCAMFEKIVRTKNKKLHNFIMTNLVWLSKLKKEQKSVQITQIY